MRQRVREVTSERVRVRETRRSEEDERRVGERLASEREATDRKESGEARARERGRE